MKKIVYIALWIILGLILSSIFHAVIEIFYLKWAEANNIVVHWTLNGACALPLWLIILLPILSIIFGVWLGLTAWRKVYIEKVRGK